MKAIKIIIRATILIILFSAIYLVVFVIPNLLVKKEFTKAVKVIYPKYLYLSEIRSYQTSYISLKSESMQFGEDKNTYLKMIDEGSKNLEDAIKVPYKKGFLLFPDKEVSINLDYIQKNDAELSLRAEDIILKQPQELEKIKNLNSALANLYAYDMGVDFGGFDETLDSDRQIIIERVNAASEGLLKVSDNLSSLGDDYKSFSPEIRNLSSGFSEMAKYLENGDYSSYKTLFNKTLNDYEKVRRDAFQLEIDVFKQRDYLEILASEKEVLQKYDSLLKKIDEMQIEK